MIVSRKPGWINAYCFRCNDGGSIRIQEPLYQKLARLAKEADATFQAAQKVDLPEPRELNPQAWPVECREWLYKAGFSNARIKELGIYYCKAMNRVVLPVLDDGAVVYWQARDCRKGYQIKYVNPRVPPPLVKFPRQGSKTLVLTEDYLSAAKVATVTEAWSLLGTSITEGEALQVKARGLPVIVGLDPDAAGRKGAAKVAKTLRLLGVTAIVSFMQRDPKLHSHMEIESWVNSLLP